MTDDDKADAVMHHATDVADSLRHVAQLAAETGTICVSTAIAKMRSAAFTVEALQAEVDHQEAMRTRQADGWQALVASYKRLTGAADEIISRATAAEAEAATLRAEVEKALEEAAYKPGDFPIVPAGMNRALARLRSALAQEPRHD